METEEELAVKDKEDVFRTGFAVHLQKEVNWNSLLVGWYSEARGRSDSAFGSSDDTVEPEIAYSVAAPHTGQYAALLGRSVPHELQFILNLPLC